MQYITDYDGKMIWLNAAQVQELKNTNGARHKQRIETMFAFKAGTTSGSEKLMWETKIRRWQTGKL